MTFLIIAIIACALAVAFLALTTVEAHSGSRVFAASRTRLDGAVGRAEFIVEHVDLLEFARDELRHYALKLGHDIAHLSLRLVRSAERALTRLLRRLRSSGVADTAPRATAREFVKTLSEFKGTLEATRPDVPEL